MYWIEPRSFKRFTETLNEMNLSESGPKRVLAIIGRGDCSARPHHLLRVEQFVQFLPG
jgi:hypothetical protein